MRFLFRIKCRSLCYQLICCGDSCAQLTPRMLMCSPRRVALLFSSSDFRLSCWCVMAQHEVLCDLKFLPTHLSFSARVAKYLQFLPGQLHLHPQCCCLAGVLQNLKHTAKIQSAFKGKSFLAPFHRQFTFEALKTD